MILVGTLILPAINNPADAGLLSKITKKIARVFNKGNAHRPTLKSKQETGMKGFAANQALKCGVKSADRVLNNQNIHCKKSSQKPPKTIDTKPKLAAKVKKPTRSSNTSID